MNRHLKSLLPHGIVVYLAKRKAERARRVGSRDRGDEFACPVCGTGLKSFDPLPAFYADCMRTHGFPYGPHDFETLNVEHYSCPCCRATDRERLYALYCDDVSGRMLDFSPSPAIDGHFRNNLALDYKTADLLVEDVDFRSVDVTDLVFRDALFDFVICSHVLEHVGDVDRAMAELHRVLKPAGRCIAMVPIVAGLKETLEDPRHTTESERWRHYGQGDHLRLLSRDDFVRRLQGAGFDVELLGADHFGHDTFRRHGISSSSTLYVGTKR